MNMVPSIRKWLDEQGYPLEMQAASAFREVGLEVEQSTYYQDPETDKAREIDVEATSRSAPGFINIKFFVECKSGAKPWVLFCSDHTLRNYNHMLAFCAMSDNAKRECSVFAIANDMAERFPWWKKEGVVAAYSVRQAFTNEVDSAYTAAMNVSKACHCHVGTKLATSMCLHFAFPVIVVDSPLVQCRLDATGQVELLEVEQGEFLFRGHPLGTCIRIITASYLPVFAAEAKRVADQLRQDLKESEDKIINQMKRRAEGRRLIR